MPPQIRNFLVMLVCFPSSPFPLLQTGEPTALKLQDMISMAFMVLQLLLKKNRWNCVASHSACIPVKGREICRSAYPHPPLTTTHARTRRTVFPFLFSPASFVSCAFGTCWDKSGWFSLKIKITATLVTRKNGTYTKYAEFRMEMKEDNSTSV